MTARLKNVSDFEWASVGQYMTWLEGRLSLHDINSSHVISFSVTRTGPLALERRKRRTEALLRDNMAKLERFVGTSEDDLSEAELVIIRSMYRTCAHYAVICDEHAKQACRISDLLRPGFEGIEDGTDDPLF